MNSRSRALRLASATAAALMSGGVAWAASGVSVPTVARVHASADSTTSSTDTTSAEPPTTDTTTTIVEETTTTVAETTTTVPAQTPTSPQECKPGWGYGDTNHCHSGPPGLNKKHGHKKP
jgi:hypothetical protein